MDCSDEESVRKAIENDRQSVKKAKEAWQQASGKDGHILSCGESFISIVAVYHAENIESQTSFRWDIDIFTSELPSVWHISLGADVAFISIINVDKTIFFLLYEFLQLLGDFGTGWKTDRHDPYISQFLGETLRDRRNQRAGNTFRTGSEANNGLLGRRVGTHRAAARVSPLDVFLYVYIPRQGG